MVDMLIVLEDASRGAYRWSETAGLKQLIRSRPISDSETTEWLRKEYLTYGQPELSRAIG